jgi:hypothetical protein
MLWAECSGCCRVLSDDDVTELDAVDIPCPRCGHAGEERATWPPYETTAFLKIVDSSDADPRGLRVRTLFLAAACEHLMGEIIWETMMHLRVPIPVAKQFLKDARGRNGLLSRYKVLTERGASDVLREAGLLAWYEAWTTLAVARNTYGHGKWRRATVRDEEAAEAVRVVRSSFARAFAVLKNAAVAEALAATRTPGS